MRPRVVHVVATGNFAGTEQYVASVANELADRGWQATVIGGKADAMRVSLVHDVRWLPGATPAAALRSLVRAGRQDVCHAHLTAAEAVSVAGRPFHRAPVVSTRHFAARRGSSVLGRLAAPVIGAAITREVAVSEFVAARTERRPHATVLSGVRPGSLLWRPESRTVLVMHRLEREKDTLTALRAWTASGLADHGWALRVVGDGSERAMLEEHAAECPGEVSFVGWSSDVPAELARAGLLLATAPAEPFGLAVVEAMAAGVPVVAAASGGHLETAGRVAGAPGFPPGDAEAAGEVLRRLVDDELRADLSEASRRVATETFTVERQVDGLLAVYASARPRIVGVAEAVR